MSLSFDSFERVSVHLSTRFGDCERVIISMVQASQLLEAVEVECIRITSEAVSMACDQ